MGSAKVANVVMLGALLEETECLPPESAIAVLEKSVKNPKILELDKKALAAGRDFIDKQVFVGAVPGPDGYAY
jgi:Pyruvate/2-oxoacid:ferredoxin oxidoreductase gamma subunit